MMETIEANWLVFGLALLAALLVGLYLFGRASKTPAKREYKPDVLDQGAASVSRNQALIDAAPAVQITPTPIGAAMAGVAEAVAIGAQDVVEEVEARAAEMEVVPEVEVAPPPPPPPPPSPPPPPPPVEVPEPAPEPEPVEIPAPEQEPAPEPEPEPAPPAAEPSDADDLSRIKGLGPKLQALLPTLGITTYAQIAAMTEADLAELDSKLGPFAGRPVKDSWVEQARFLASGDTGGFEAKFGKV